MGNGNKPASLEQKEITDAITALQDSKKAPGTCTAHVDIVDATILQLRIGEQLLYSVSELSTRVQDKQDGADWLGGFKFGKRQATGLVAIVFAIGTFVCVMKWGPSLVKAFYPDTPAIERTHHPEHNKMSTNTDYRTSMNK
jgi:hypothetical protein